MAKTNGANEQVQEIAQDVSEELREIGRDLRKRANDVRKEVVKQLNSAAETIRKETREATEDADTRKRADEVARGLEKAAHYLNTHSVEQMGNQATKAVRRNPMRAIIITFVVGLLLGMMMRGSEKK